MEAINELLDKIKELIQKNQNDINTNSELIESSGNSIEDKRLITDTLSNIENVTLLEERIDVISKYATDDEARTIRYFIATYNNFAPIMRKKFFNSNKGIIAGILKKIDSSIVIADIDSLRKHNERMNSHIAKINELKEKIINKSIVQEDFAYIYNFCKVLDIDVVNFMQEYSINSLSPLYSQVIVDEPVEQVLEKNERMLTEEELIELFKKYNCDFTKLKNNKKEELLKYGVLENIEGILESFRSYNIDLGAEYNNGTLFTEIPSLIDLFKYAKAEDVRKTLESLKEYGILNSERALIESLKTINKFISRKVKYKKRKKSSGSESSNNSLSGKMEDFKLNLDYFYGEFKVAILKKNPDMQEGQIKDQFIKLVYNKCAFIFSKSYEKNMSSVEVLKRYTFSENLYLASLSCLQTTKMSSQIDKMIETDCFEYLCDNLSVMRYDYLMNFIINAKQKLGLDNASTFRNRANNHILRLKDEKITCNKKDIEGLFEARGINSGSNPDGSYIKKEKKEVFARIDQTVKKEFDEGEEDFFKNFDYNKSIVESKGFEYFDKLSEFIDEKNPIIIRIDGVPISMIKLLRIYSIYNNHSSEDSLDRLMYAITFNSHYTKEQVDIIEKKIYSFEPKGKEKIK